MKDIVFVKSVFKLEQIPDDEMPEIVLCGRSNVGKSSFINSLFNRKKLAQTSSSPGKTRGINYYRVDQRFYLVDLPGFGYAKVSKKEREGWQKLIERYLIANSKIQLVLHLIDSRIPPTPLDTGLNDFLNDIGLPYNFILTKVDKLGKKQQADAVTRLTEYFPEASPDDNVISYSSVKGTGKKEMIKRLNSLF